MKWNCHPRRRYQHRKPAKPGQVGCVGVESAVMESEVFRGPYPLILEEGTLVEQRQVVLFDERDVFDRR
jgi:hypothetical protein